MREFLELSNEILSAGIIVVAASILLYNLSHGLKNAIARTATIVLGAVTVVALGDVVLALGPATIYSLNAWLRLQWIGIALMPAALFHLSHALLSTTGRPSRWRRRIGTLILYTLGFTFMIAAALTDQLVHSPTEIPVPRLKAGPFFPVYLFYTVSASALALFNVIRARTRCLTDFTRRRMSFMLYTILTPIIGVFPYTVLIGSVPETNLRGFWLLVTLSNVGLILMLSFMSFPLFFFVDDTPDRVIKAELLEFFLRGPLVGMATLAVIIGLPRAGEVFGIPGQEIMPLAAVATLIVLQWAITRLQPLLERRFIYANDRAEIQQIRKLNARLLTRTDIDQLLEGILASACDYLQVSTAFVVSITTDGPVLEQSMGKRSVVDAVFQSGSLDKLPTGPNHDSSTDHTYPNYSIVAVDNFWFIPLRNGSNGNGHTLIGVMAVQARTPQPALLDEEVHVLAYLAERAAQTLHDMRIQAEIFSRLEQMTPEMEVMDQLRWVTRYRGEPGETAESIVGKPEFETAVKEALGHYWGGPRLTQSKLINLNSVKQALNLHGGNPANAVRAVLQDGVERLKPADQMRSMTAAEWTLYNILEMRFIQGRKVRDVAKRLAMSESDFYRKQRVAVSELARVLGEMEQEASQPTPLSENAERR
jgi:hypothetical protein